MEGRKVGMSERKEESKIRMIENCAHVLNSTYNCLNNCE